MKSKICEKGLESGAVITSVCCWIFINIFNEVKWIKCFLTVLHRDLEAGDKENQNNRVKVSMGSELYLKNYKIGTCGCHPIFSPASSVLFDRFPSILMTHLVCKVSVSTQECPPGTRLEYILDLGYPKMPPITDYLHLLPGLFSQCGDVCSFFKIH